MHSCGISFDRTQDLHCLKNYGKFVITASPMPAKITSISSFKVSILHAKCFTIPYSRIRDKSIIKISRKIE